MIGRHGLGVPYGYTSNGLMYTDLVIYNLEIISVVFLIFYYTHTHTHAFVVTTLFYLSVLGSFFVKFLINSRLNFCQLLKCESLYVATVERPI